MQDSQGRESRYVMHGPVTTPRVLQPRTRPVAPRNEHLPLIAAACFAFGWVAMAVVLHHHR